MSRHEELLQYGGVYAEMWNQQKETTEQSLSPQSPTSQTQTISTVRSDF